MSPLLIQPRLRRAARICLAVWGVIWVLFMAMRFLPVDIRRIPGIGPFLLASLAGVFLAPLLAAGLAAICVLRRDRVPADWLVLALAVVILPGQMVVFRAASWL